MFKIVSDLTCIHCDSGVRAEGGSIDRFSSKVSFMRRLTSCIVEYALSLEILHFHYDLWLFKSVGGSQWVTIVPAQKPNLWKPNLFL